MENLTAFTIESQPEIKKVDIVELRREIGDNIEKLSNYIREMQDKIEELEKEKEGPDNES